MKLLCLLGLLLAAAVSVAACGPARSNASISTATPSVSPTATWVTLGSLDFRYVDGDGGDLGPVYLRTGNVRVVARVTTVHASDGSLLVEFCPRLGASAPTEPPPGCAWDVTRQGTYEWSGHLPPGDYSVCVSKEPGFVARVTVYFEDASPFRSVPADG